MSATDIGWLCCAGAARSYVRKEVFLGAFAFRQRTLF